jgi:hypothetical protein
MLTHSRDIAWAIGIAVVCCLFSATGAQVATQPASIDTLATEPDDPDAAVREPASSDTARTKSPSGAMLRSLAVPGWGQFYNEQWLKGICVAGAELGIIANAFVQNHLADRAVTKEEREFYLDNRNLSYWWLAGIILLSMADAYVDAHLYGFDESIDLGFDGSGETAPYRADVRVVVTFNF